MYPSFNSVDELKKRLTPALRIRGKELKKQGIIVTQEELWYYFVNNFWKNATNLSLYDMVNDILNEKIDIIKKSN